MAESAAGADSAPPLNQTKVGGGGGGPKSVTPYGMGCNVVHSTYGNVESSRVMW
jgi:hypothetical protein